MAIGLGALKGLGKLALKKIARKEVKAETRATEKACETAAAKKGKQGEAIETKKKKKQQCPKRRIKQHTRELKEALAKTKNTKKFEYDRFGKNNAICGGLAGAVNYEVITKKLVGGKTHDIKAEGAMNAYEKLNEKVAKAICAKTKTKKKVTNWANKQIATLKKAQAGQLKIRKCK